MKLCTLAKLDITFNKISWVKHSFVSDGLTNKQMTHMRSRDCGSSLTIRKVFYLELFVVIYFIHMLIYGLSRTGKKILKTLACVAGAGLQLMHYIFTILRLGMKTLIYLAIYLFNDIFKLSTCVFMSSCGGLQIKKLSSLFFHCTVQESIHFSKKYFIDNNYDNNFVSQKTNVVILFNN